MQGINGKDVTTAELGQNLSEQDGSGWWGLRDRDGRMLHRVRTAESRAMAKWKGHLKGT